LVSTAFLKCVRAWIPKLLIAALIAMCYSLFFQTTVTNGRSSLVIAEGIIRYEYWSQYFGSIKWDGAIKLFQIKYGSIFYSASIEDLFGIPKRSYLLLATPTGTGKIVQRVPLGLPFIFTVAVLFAAHFVIGRIVQKREVRLEQARRCIQCGYDLTGLESNRCPECGNDITTLRKADLNPDPQTQDTTPSNPTNS